MLVRHTAVLGALLLAGIGMAIARKQATAASALPASNAAVPAQSASTAQITDQKTAEPAVAAKPRNYLELLPAPSFNRTTIVIDPAHGGTDNGARISDSTVEKDVTLSLAFRLRSLLAARGFNVVLTRDSDAANQSTAPFAPLTLDDRAGLANHQRAAACLLLHATASGSGVHLYASQLSAVAGETVPGPWLTLQAAWVPQSQRLESRFSQALGRSRIPVIDGQASVRPLDSLTCPALVLELAPHGDDPNSINDVDYQQRVAQAITGALVFWKDAAQPPPRLVPESASPSGEEAMSLRGRRITFWILIGCIVAMGIVLFAHRERTRGRIERLADATPLDAPYTDEEPVTLDLANDTEGSITAVTRQLALPTEETARARALLDHLIAEYSLPGSAHPLEPGVPVNEVFLIPLPVVGHAISSTAQQDDGHSDTIPVASADPNAPQPATPGGEMAVIDLRGSFVNQHPSGVEVEQLTILSIIGTLHTNLPQIEQIRFLVDGQSRETLAGHADLLRTYPSRDTTTDDQTPAP